MPRAGISAWTLLSCLLFCSDAQAWIFPEHRDIGRVAIDQLDDESKNELNRIWKAANPSHSPRLCGQPSEIEEVPRVGDTPCADLAMLFAVAGDHSCSPADLDNVVLNSAWFPRVSIYTAEVKQELKDSDDLNSKLNIWNRSNVQLLKIDSGYLSRASNNNAHFPLASLPVSENESLESFLFRSTRADAPVNAMGVYSRYHLAALRYARLGMTREALFSEAFAIHFLQDLFSSGHYAGTWGDSAQRKGTHDYYSEKGLITQTWGGERYSGHGDAFITLSDIRHSSSAVQQSLRQFLHAFSDRRAEPGSPVPSDFKYDVCVQPSMNGPTPLAIDDSGAFKAILSTVPIPSEGESGVYLPRYRIETGPFISASSGVRFGAAIGGLSESDESIRTINRLELLGRLGMGTVGVLSTRSDGAMFLEFGLVADGTQFNGPQLAPRSGQRFGIRMPFWLVPFDLLVLAPVLYFPSKATLQNIAISASNGGLLSLERKFDTFLGTIQLMAGRQFAVTVYGYLWSEAPRITNANGTTLGTYRSYELDFPLIEHTPGHTFATKLAFDYRLQFGYAIEIPTSVTAIDGASAGAQNLISSSILYLRFSLEGIQYR